MSSEPSKMTGKYEQTKGSTKETLGNLTGAASLEQRGREQHAQGEAKVQQARGAGYAEGTKDRFTGALDSVLGIAKGNESQQTQGNARREKGATQQDFSRNI